MCVQVCGAAARLGIQERLCHGLTQRDYDQGYSGQPTPLSSTARWVFDHPAGNTPSSRPQDQQCFGAPTPDQAPSAQATSGPVELVVFRGASCLTLLSTILLNVFGLTVYELAALYAEAVASLTRSTWSLIPTITPDLPSPTQLLQSHVPFVMQNCTGHHQPALCEAVVARQQLM